MPVAAHFIKTNGGKVMPIQPVKTAIVGCGAISGTYIPNLLNLFSIIDLVALCDLIPAAAEKRAKEFGVARVMTMEEIEASPEIELVVNLTGPDAHYDVIRRMLFAGKHVFTEKTLAANFEQGSELTALAREKGLYLGAAPDTILGAGLQTARKILDAGLIGRPTSCVACANRDHLLNSELFPFIQRSAAGAFAYDVGVYYVAALLSLLGPVKTVFGFSAKAPEHHKEVLFLNAGKDGWQMPGTDLLAGTVAFENGMVGNFHFDGLSINQEQPILTIYGTEGILKLGDPNRFDGSVTLIRPEAEPCVLPFTHGYDGTYLEGCAEAGRGHRGVGAAEMAWAIREKRACRCSADFALHTLELLQAMERSAQEGKPWQMRSHFSIAPLASGYYNTTFGGILRADAENSLRMKDEV